jgi:hypothetical protein
MEKAAAKADLGAIIRQKLRSASMTPSRSIGRVQNGQKARADGTALGPIALRHEGIGTSHGLESDKKNDQLGLC